MPGDSSMSTVLPSTLEGEHPSVVNAYLETDTIIVVRLADPLTLPFAASDVTLTDTKTGKTIPVVDVGLPQASSAFAFGHMQQPQALPGEQLPTAPAGVQTDLVEVMLAQAPDVTHSLDIALTGYMQASVTPRNVLNGGKYLAFTERGTTGPYNIATGVDHLKELGITHVQLQPVQEFASVDEHDPNQYNWGYDPRNFNVPEGAYATTPHGTARLTECKQMVQSLHNEGIGVTLDVVYNHTFAWYYSDFDKIVPEYYYRTDDAGNYTNGSGTGNETATERPMVQKFVLDSLAYWVREYHVDGFRFDLMALLGIETMKNVFETLHAINPHILLYGEPWTGGTSGLAAHEQLTKGQQKGLGVAVFNDHIRDGLCGSVFDPTGRGFATGALGSVDRIKKAVEGSINDFTASPGETINYVTSHDNYTLWDKLTFSNPDDTEADRMMMDELAQAVIFTSQGAVFLQGGEEMLRTKGGNSNSYNAGDAVNHFDWSRKAHYWKVFKYYAALIHLRRTHPAFRMRSASAIQAHLSFLESPENTLMFELVEHANGDSWETILVIYNPNKTQSVCTLPPGNWTIVVSQDRVSESYLGQASRGVVVPAISCMVLYQE